MDTCTLANARLYLQKCEYMSIGSHFARDARFAGDISEAAMFFCDGDGVTILSHPTSSIG